MGFLFDEHDDFDYNSIAIIKKPRPMRKTSSPEAMRGDVLLFERLPPNSSGEAPELGDAPADAAHSYRVQVHSEAMSQVLEAVMPMLGRVLQEKTAQAREKKLEDYVGLMAQQLVVPSTIDRKMAQRLALRRARVLNEFGYATAEQLADANQSRAGNRHALADNWKKRRQVFAVSHRDEAGRMREVFPLFQFDEHKPIRAVQAILDAFGERKSPWKLALWFTSNNGWLPSQARPVDLLASAPDAVVEAARRDAAGSAA